MEKHSENLSVYGEKKENAPSQWKISISFESVKKCATEKPHCLLVVKLAQQKNTMWQETHSGWVKHG